MAKYIAIGALIVFSRGLVSLRELLIANTTSSADVLTNYLLASGLVFSLGGLFGGVTQGLKLRAELTSKNTLRLVWLSLVPAATALISFTTSTDDTYLPYAIGLMSLPLFVIQGKLNSSLILKGQQTVLHQVSLAAPIISLVGLAVIHAARFEATAVILMSIVWVSTLGATAAAEWVGRKTHLPYVQSRPQDLDYPRLLLMVGLAALSTLPGIAERFIVAELGATDLAVFTLTILLSQALVSNSSSVIANEVIAKGSGFPILKAFFVTSIVGALLLISTSFTGPVLLIGPLFDQGAHERFFWALTALASLFPMQLANSVRLRVWHTKASRKKMVQHSMLVTTVGIALSFIFSNLFGLQGIFLSFVTTQWITFLWLNRVGQNTITPNPGVQLLLVVPVLILFLS